MRSLWKHIAAAAFLFCAFCLFGTAVYAEEAESFNYYLGGYENAGAGAELICFPDEEAGTVSVAINDINTGSSSTYDVAIPEKIEYDGTVYTVTVMRDATDLLDYAIDPSVASKIGSLKVPDSVREIKGNLFNWNRTNKAPADCLVISRPANYSDSYPSFPDTQTMLNDLPAFITDHYTSGAYYAGKCLARVDPGFTGTFTVRTGTICILASAFEGCTGISEVRIPSSVEFIGTRAFANSSVSAVNIPAGLTEHSDEIYNYTFYNCTNLRRVSFDADAALSKIDYCAFMGCSALSGFDFSKVSCIGGLAFAKALKNVSVRIRPDQLTGDSVGAFAGSGILSVKFLDNETPGSSYFLPAECFRGCVNLTSVTLHPEIERLSAGCFEGCRKLKSDILAQSGCKVQSLDYRCFADTGLVKATIPATIDDLEGGVFAENPNLKTLDVKTGSASGTLFSILNDIRSGVSYTDFATNIYFGGSNAVGTYCRQPEKENNTFIETLNLYCMPWFDVNLQPYLKTVNFMFDIREVKSQMFIGCPALSTVTFQNPSALVSIGNGAFEYCPGLTDFPFQQLTGLTRIGSRAFMLVNSGYMPSEKAALSDARAGYGLHGMLDLSQCSSLTILGSCCFYNQYNVTALKLPASLRAFENEMYSGYNQFGGMCSLDTVTANGSLSAFSPGMGNIFYAKPDKPSYTSKFSGNSIQPVNETIRVFNAPNAAALPYSGFSNMTGLESITLGGLEEISQAAFTYCINLKNIRVPDALKADSSFVCFTDSLESVYAPKLKKLENYAFIYSGIKDISLPAVETAGEGAFMYCKYLTDVSLPVLTKLNGVHANTFLGCDSLKNADLGLCEELPPQTFIGCPDLETVTADSLKTIGERAFLDCKIKEVAFSNVETLGYGAFMRCDKLESVLLPNLKAIETHVFLDCEKLKQVDLGECEVLPSETFLQCGALETVAADSLKTIGKQGFLESGIKEADFPNVETLGYGAFMDCKRLAKVSLPKLQTIGTLENSRFFNSMTFYHCEALESVNLGCVTKIPSGTFSCTGLKSVTIPAGIEYDPYVFNNCGSLETVIVEEGVTTIPYFMFSDCGNLQYVSLPSTLQTIGWGAFKNCGSKLHISIPENVTKIEDDAFAKTDAEVLLNGTDTEFEIQHFGEEGYTYNFSEADLKPLEKGSVIYCADQNVLSKAKAYCAQTDTAKAPDVILVPKLDKTLEGAPEEVTAGEELDLDGFKVLFGGAEVSAEDYSMDYDRSDETIGTRAVAVFIKDMVASGVTVDREDISAFDLLGNKKSGQSVSFSGPDEPADSSFDVNVVSGIYTVTEGDGQTLEEGSETAAAFKIERNVANDTVTNRLENITVDGKQIEAGNYSAGEDGFILKPEYMKTLEAGDHAIIFGFNDKGAANAKLSVKEAAATYAFSAGDKQTWAKGSKSDLTFTVKRSIHDERTFGRFTGVTVDGQAVPEGKFTKAEGSLVLTLKADYLETLAEGAHKIEAVFTDGKASGDVTIGAKPAETPGETTPVETTPAETETTADRTAQTGKDGTALGEGASAEAAEKAITSMKSDSDPAGAKYAPLMLKSSKQANNTVTLTWKKLKNAKKYVIYGNKCGKKNKPKKLMTVTGKSKTVKKIAGKKLKKGTYYKFIIVALDQNNNVVSTSKLIHAGTKGSKKTGNYKSVTVKSKVKGKWKAVKKVSLKKGKTLQLKASAVRALKTTTGKMHVKIRYESSNTGIATVSKTGKIKGMKKGTCSVYAFSHNGVGRKIKITVK